MLTACLLVRFMGALQRQSLVMHLNITLFWLLCTYPAWPCIASSDNGLDDPGRLCTPCEGLVLDLRLRLHSVRNQILIPFWPDQRSLSLPVA